MSLESRIIRRSEIKFSFCTGQCKGDQKFSLIITAQLLDQEIGCLSLKAESCVIDVELFIFINKRRALSCILS